MKSDNGNFAFVSKEQLLDKVAFSNRSGEFQNGDHLRADVPSPKFMIVGISESIGPFANKGRPGTENAFDAFLTFFLAMPYRDTSFDILGKIVFIGFFPSKTHEAASLVEELDRFAESVLIESIGPQQLPIIIGGGHNNALPIIRWAASHRKLHSIINIDAHMDCRTPDARHSGNAFSFALIQDLIQSYVVLGVDSYSLNTFMLEFLDRFPITIVAFDEYLLGRSLNEDMHCFTGTQLPTGLEIDLDSIANMPSSAQSPTGFSLNQVRSAVLSIKKTDIAYLHLCEGAPTNTFEERMVGKALCYLVLDFMKVME